MPDLFKEIIPSILKTKKSVINNDIEAKDYKPFLVNRALSYHYDCIPYVNEINQYPFLDNDIQYQYLINTIRSMKRDFKPWQKSKTDIDLESVKTFFGYSNEKAKEAMKLLTPEQITEIKIRTDQGGVKK